jgi:hypothetical protein
VVYNFSLFLAKLVHTIVDDLCEVALGGTDFRPLSTLDFAIKESGESLILLCSYDDPHNPISLSPDDHPHGLNVIINY